MLMTPEIIIDLIKLAFVSIKGKNKNKIANFKCAVSKVAIERYSSRRMA